MEDQTSSHDETQSNQLVDDFSEARLLLFRSSLNAIIEMDPQTLFNKSVEQEQTSHHHGSSCEAAQFLREEGPPATENNDSTCQEESISVEEKPASTIETECSTRLKGISSKKDDLDIFKGINYDGNKAEQDIPLHLFNPFGYCARMKVAKYLQGKQRYKTLAKILNVRDSAMYVIWCDTQSWSKKCEYVIELLCHQLPELRVLDYLNALDKHPHLRKTKMKLSSQLSEGDCRHICFENIVHNIKCCWKMVSVITTNAYHHAWKDVAAAFDVANLELIDQLQGAQEVELTSMVLFSHILGARERITAAEVTAIRKQLPKLCKVLKDALSQEKQHYELLLKHCRWLYL